MNTESRGQSNQNRQKDKACERLQTPRIAIAFREAAKDISTASK
jgi:hypothetical protein